ncbi:MAG: hydantoinase/oxoprolinase family protein, partial [Planctomycetota bacterium]
MDAVGIDAGGTFTDLVQLELGSGRIRAVHKRPSSPAQPAQAVLEAFAATGASPDEVRLVHGSTVATNALLERTLATTALVTNAGFEDAIEIGRQHRPRLYALQPRRARPIVPRALRFGIGGRIGPRGERWEPLDPAELAALRERLGRSGAETIAVCLLHSYRDGGDEREVARALAPLGLPITCSHAVLPEHREFERCSTTVVNAALIPRMRRYLAALAPLGDGLWIMRSDGGVGAAAAIAEQPVWTLLSGPAGGVVGAELAAARAGIGPFLSIDVGGTSSDVALGGAPLRAGAEIGGIEVAHPSVDLVTIGAGGGSIAWRDAGGALRVGPRSAGADPGPACYGRGGTEPTLTDACLLLGRLPDTGLLGGAFPLERERAEHAIARLARAFDLAPLALARGIVAVALEATTRALRRVSVERGEDPRERALVAFGGAGGLLAGDLVRSLGLRGALVPPEPGVLSALGMAGAPLTLRLAETLLEPLEPAGRKRLAEAFARLERQA